MVFHNYNHLALPQASTTTTTTTTTTKTYFSFFLGVGGGGLFKPGPCTLQHRVWQSVLDIMSKASKCGTNAYTSRATFYCSSSAKSEPIWLRAEGLKVKAKCTRVP